SEGPPHRGALSRCHRESILRVRRHAAGGPRRHPEQDPSRRPRRQGSLRPGARGGQENTDGLPLARHGARLPGQGPGIPEGGRRLYRRSHRRLYRAEDEGSDPLAHDHAPDRAGDVLQPVRKVTAVTSPAPRFVAWRRWGYALDLCTPGNRGLHWLPWPRLRPRAPWSTNGPTPRA